MKIEIWSDVVCPFCYIGKRHLEKALETFPHQDKIEIEWHSYELDPHAPKKVAEDLYERLASKYGKTREWAIESTNSVTERAAAVGLEYHLDKAVPTNTLDAHRLIHMATAHGLQDEAEERLFQAYFTEGKNIGDRDTLTQLGVEIGLEATEVDEMLAGTQYTNEVRADEAASQQLGVRGVPFFVLDRKYAISGAQPIETFQRAIQKTWEEQTPVAIENLSENDDNSCEDGSCDI